MNRDEIKTILPHREPMLLLDEAVLTGDGMAEAKYTVRGDEFFLQGHFPDNPIVPGVIQCEMMAQASCVLFADALKEKDALAVYTGIDKARFRGMVKPGDTVCITVKPLRSCPPLYTVHAELRVGERLCSGGDLSFAVTRRDGCSQNC
ncbi:MAG: beta-hydroxyacyl-ACP dehydratase [Lachnospiraceae bacterium]|nr:beta-hydroxyacyl-ACP dehydratase [Lachnospiraceae bacterium]